ncbi:MAG: sigma-70 family RNA polymerase sigma factor, partial [Cyanobacteria bacterium P01_C01_bin.121]
MHATSHCQLKQQSGQLLRSYCEQRTPALRNRIVQLNIGLVRREAHHCLRLRRTTESFDDLMQVGSIGLIKAIERFDCGKGAQLSTFAIPHIRGEIRHYLRDKSATVRIPRRWQTLMSQATEVACQLRTELGREPT